MKTIDKMVTIMYFELLNEQKYSHKEIVQIIQIFNQLMKLAYISKTEPIHTTDAEKHPK